MIMNTLEFLEMSKSFRYTGEGFTINGSATYSGDMITSFSGNITVMDNEMPVSIGNFYSRQDGSDFRMDINNLQMVNIDTVVTAVKALLAELTANESESE